MPNSNRTPSSGIPRPTVGRGKGPNGSGKASGGKSGSGSRTGLQRTGLHRAAAGGKGTTSKSSRARATGTRSAVLRRPPTSGLPLLRYRLRSSWRDLLEAKSLWMALFVAATVYALLPEQALRMPDLDEGSIAPRTVLAGRDISVVDETATRTLQEREEQDVLPVYDLDRGLEATRQRQIAALFAAGRAELEAASEAPATQPSGDDAAARESDEENFLARLREASSLRLEAEPVRILRARGFPSDLEERLGAVLSGVLNEGVVHDRELLLEHRVRGITVRELPSNQASKQLDLFRYLDYPEQVRQTVAQELRAWDDLSPQARRGLIDLVVANVTPNLTFNSSATLALRQRAAESTGAVVHTFGAGEVIVRKGARIDALRASALAQMRGNRDLRLILLSIAGTVLLACGAILLLWLAVGQADQRDRSQGRRLSEALILLSLALVVTRLSRFVADAVAVAFERDALSVASSYTFAIPFAAVAMSAALLYGRDLALVLSLIFSLFAGQLAGGDGWTTTVFCLASCLAAIFALDQKQYRQRSMMTRAAFVVGLTNMVAILALRTFSGAFEGGPLQIGFDLVWGFVGAILAAAVTSFGLPIFESAFRITTSIKLIELANPNLPLLRRLAFEAPGTFQHSLAVANLAKAGVEAIDGDAILVHTAGLYHDIGKVSRPQYFIENQPPGQNPHDKVQPSMSALILINHVKEGIEMAETYGLPNPILDAIEQHHGTRLIKFFYSRAKERCDPETEAIREEDFRYPGPKPQSKEMGVLMLADAIEAASRTLIQPSRQKLRGVVQAVYEDCLRDGQLDQTDLTLGHLKLIEEAFLRVLSNVYHRRVEYPGFDFNKTKGDAKSDTKSDPKSDPKSDSKADTRSVPKVETTVDTQAAETDAPPSPVSAPAAAGDRIDSTRKKAS